MTPFLTFVRAAHLAACLLLQAIFAISFLALMPAWQRFNAATAPVRTNVQRGLRRLSFACLGIALVTGFLWLWLSIAGMSGSTMSESLQPSLFSMVLTQTQPGHVWVARFALCVILGALVIWDGKSAHSRPCPSTAQWLGAFVALALTGSIAWLGHAGASDEPGHNIQLTGDIFHLLAVGVWPAGLVPFALFLYPHLKTRDSRSLQVAWLASRRFSSLSLVTVGILVLSGAINSYYLVGTLHAVVTTQYGQLLLLKVVLFLVTIAIGGWNLFQLKPRVAASGDGTTESQSEVALARVARNVIIEIVLSTIVLLIVGWLGILPPAAHS